MVIIHTMKHGEADSDSGLGYFFDSIAGTRQTSVQTENLI